MLVPLPPYSGSLTSAFKCAFESGPNPKSELRRVGVLRGSSPAIRDPPAPPASTASPPLRRSPPCRPGEPRLAPPARPLQEDGAPAEGAQEPPTLLGRAVEDVGGLEAGSRHRVTQHRPAVAAAPLLRALDQALRRAHRGPPTPHCRDQGSRHTDGCGQSVVGRPENSRGTSPVGDRRLRAHRLSAHAEAAPPAVSDLADVPRQPCLRSGLPRFLHGANRAPARPLCSRRARSPPPARRPLQRDRASHRPLDRPADRGCLSGRLRALLSPARP